MTPLPKKEISLAKMVSYTLLIVVGLWLMSFLFLLIAPEVRGSFDEIFSSTSALFSGLAFGGIIITIYLQRDELRLQREELRETRKEFIIQNETLKLQRFENTFFNLLNLHHQIVNAIDYRQKKITKISGSHISPVETSEIIILHGRDVFRFQYDILCKELSQQPVMYQRIYMKHYEDVQTDFGHYFRNLYRMIKMVHEFDFYPVEAEVSDSDRFAAKYKYTSIIRSQLSDYELLWIFYNCLSSNGQEKFKPLVEKYTIFKNLPKKLLASQDHIILFSSSAYGRK